MTRIQSVLTIVLFALTLVTLCWASITGSISGVVMDPSGAVVSGATVTATSTQTGIKNAVVTDAKGFCSFQSLPIGWTLSGITTFATGLPISLSEDDDNSLTGTFTAPVDVPDYTPGHLLIHTDPRSRLPYFNTALFTPEQLGTIGNSRRRFFHGPGINNFNIALLKSIAFTESKQLQLRFEAFNAFNHAQFNNPNGNVNSTSSFGLVTSARDPRIMQVAMKFLF